MRKPIVLLVDDEAELLEALEASLAPALGPVARIEAFTHPLEALAFVSRCQEEASLVALAIVDQRMPRMEGTALLQALRECPAATWTQAILLTGYAGLDSALEAINAAAADRYLEKPWSAAALCDLTGVLLASFFSCSGIARHFLLREALTARDLEALFRLRYRVFREGPAAAFCPPCPNRIDTDAYDLHSRHFGLYLTQPETQPETVGNLRVVEARDRNAPALPLLEYFPDTEVLARLVGEIHARGARVVEPSRLALAAPARSLPVARHVIRSAVAIYFFFHGAEHALLTCDPPHSRLYRPFGFTRTPGTSDHVLEHHGVRARCLLAAAAGVPEPARRGCEDLAERYARDGSTCCCEAQPECRGTPDPALFCPRAACRQGPTM